MKYTSKDPKWRWSLEYKSPEIKSIGISYHHKRDLCSQKKRGKNTKIIQVQVQISYWSFPGGTKYLEDCWAVELATSFCQETLCVTSRGKSFGKWFHIRICHHSFIVHFFLLSINCGGKNVMKYELGKSQTNLDRMDISGWEWTGMLAWRIVCVAQSIVYSVILTSL